MVSLTWASLVAQAAFVLSSQNIERVANQTYAQNTLATARSLHHWYETPAGLWSTTGWWNSANCLTTLADWALLDGSGAAGLNISNIFSNTFVKAETTPPKAIKRLSANGSFTSIYTYSTKRDSRPRGFSGFLNEFYDDEGWWALGWIRAWDVTHDGRYLNMAESIFADMHNGTDDVCGGGLWWSKERKYKNAIANELYLSVAASLANRVATRKELYTAIAMREWDWFKRSGMINSKNLINDGLAIKPDGACVNNGMNTWSYNQGVVLGGLVELSWATGDASYLNEAAVIATAAIALLSDDRGIMRESGGCEPNCGDDGSQFKGIFVRNLQALHKVAPRDIFYKAITANANSIWVNNRDGKNQLGISWGGPAGAGGGPNASTHSSAMDVLVAAMAVSP